MQKQHTKKFTSSKKKIFKNLILFIFSIFLFFLGASAIWVSSLKIPDLSSFEDRKIINSTKIYDRTGKILLYNIHHDVKKTDINFNKMGLNIKNATVAIEDSEFYNHPGIRIKSTLRAIIANLLGTKTQGGSTITQQLIKNTLLTQEKTYIRKIKEWVLAMKLDKSMSKEKILEFYLNESPYGGNIYGIEEASKNYFNKSTQNLTLAEAAYLAAIPQAPTSLSPYKKNNDKLEKRKNLVLARMFELKFISQNEYEKAKNEKVIFIPKTSGEIKAPHFVFFIKDYLEEKYGNENLNNDGLKIITTLDYNLQEKAEKIVKEGALTNEKKINGKNAGLVAIDPKTGQILTMVGSRDYFDKKIDGNYNIATATRQPGSSFKPFIYAEAFNKGFVPETVLFDLPTEFHSSCNAYGQAPAGFDQKNCYMPQNYGEKIRGPITLRSSLAESVNITAVKLLYLVGLKDSLRMAEELGLSTLINAARYGLTLVLGGGEVKLLEMVSAYSVFANDGIKNNYTGILKVENSDGKILEEFKLNNKKILDENIALTISDVLSDNVSRTPTFGASSNLFIPGREVAAKSGTTNNDKDAWLIGYTPSIAVGVWAGNNENTPMKKGGVAAAGPIWNKFMTEILKDLPEEKFKKPIPGDLKKMKPILSGHWQGNEEFFIDKISGKLATENTPEETKERKIITNVHSILYWLDKNNILSFGSPTYPVSPGSLTYQNFSHDSQFNNWEIPIQNWWAENKNKYANISPSDKPTETDDIHIEANKPVITILEPDINKKYLPDEKIIIKISSTGKFPLKKIDIFINNIYLGNAKSNTQGNTQSQFNFSFVPSSLDNLQKENVLKIISYDSVYNHSQTISTFLVE
ncbi:MAG: PBP1A family penicillin-binding protein [Patescibacteria group bacterium]